MVHWHILKSSTLVSQIDKSLEILEEFGSEELVAQLLMLAHLVPIAQAPALDTEVLAVSPSEISLQKLPESLESFRILLWIYPFASLIV